MNLIWWAKKGYNMIELVLSTRDLQTINEALNYAIEQVKMSSGEIQVVSDKEYTQLAVLTTLNYRIEKEIKATVNASMRRVEKVLDRTLTNAGHNLLKRDWKAFYAKPEDYKDSVVVEMVLQYLRDTDL